MAEQRDPAQHAAELHAEQNAAMAWLTRMKLTDDEAHVIAGALAFSAPAAFQRALDLVQRHRDGGDCFGKSVPATAPRPAGACEGGAQHRWGIDGLERLGLQPASERDDE